MSDVRYLAFSESADKPKSGCFLMSCFASFLADWPFEHGPYFVHSRREVSRNNKKRAEDRQIVMFGIDIASDPPAMAIV